MSKPRCARKERKREPRASPRKALTPISSRVGIAETCKPKKKKRKKNEKEKKKKGKKKAKKRITGKEKKRES